MALSNIEKQAAYRQRCRDARDRLVTATQENERLRDRLLTVEQWLVTAIEELQDVRNRLLTAEQRLARADSPLEIQNQCLEVGNNIAPPHAKRRAEKPAIGDWQPNSRHSDLAQSKGRDRSWVDDQAERMRDYVINKSPKWKDFDAAFRNWIKQAVDFEGRDRVAKFPAHRPSRGTIAEAAARAIAIGAMGK